MKNILKTFFLLGFLFPLAGCVNDNKTDTQPYEEPEEDLEPTAELGGETPQAPVLFVFSPQSSETVYGTTLTVTGSIYQGTSPFTLTATYNDGSSVDFSSDIDARSNFSFEISPLVEGANTLVLTVTDAAGSTVTQTISFTNLLEEPEATTGGETTGGSSTGESTGGSGDCVENTESDIPDFFEDVINFFENLAENLEDLEDFEVTIHESYSDRTDSDGEIFTSKLGAIDLQINSLDSLAKRVLPDLIDENNYMEKFDVEGAIQESSTAENVNGTECDVTVDSKIENIRVDLNIDDNQDQDDMFSAKILDGLTYEFTFDIPAAKVTALITQFGYDVDSGNGCRTKDALASLRTNRDDNVIMDATLKNLQGTLKVKFGYDFEEKTFFVDKIEKSTLEFKDAKMEIVKITKDEKDDEEDHDVTNNEEIDSRKYGEEIEGWQLDLFVDQVNKYIQNEDKINDKLAEPINEFLKTALSLKDGFSFEAESPFEEYGLDHLITFNYDIDSSDEDSEKVIKSYWNTSLKAHATSYGCTDGFSIADYTQPYIISPDNLGDMTLTVPFKVLGDFVFDLAKTGSLCWNYHLDLGDLGELNLDIKPYGELEIKPSGASNLEIELPFQAKARVKVPVQTKTYSGGCLDHPLQVPVNSIQRSSTPMEDLTDGIEMPGVSNSTLTGKIKLKVSLHNSCSEGLSLSLEDAELSNLEGDLEVGDLMLDSETLNTIIQKVMEDAVTQLPAIPLASQVTTIDGMAGWGVEIGDKVEVSDNALYIGINLSKETPECE